MHPRPRLCLQQDRFVAVIKELARVRGDMENEAFRDLFLTRPCDTRPPPHGTCLFKLAMRQMLQRTRRR